MYIVEARNHYGMAEKEYKYKACAIKEAGKIVSAGFLVLDNPEMSPEQRRFPVNSVRVYSDSEPDTDIDF